LFLQSFWLRANALPRTETMADERSAIQKKGVLRLCGKSLKVVTPEVPSRRRRYAVAEADMSAR